MPDDTEQLLARLEEAELQAVVSEEELRGLRSAMESVMASADATIALLREMAGTEPGPVAAEFLRMLLFGQGWFRSARDTLNRLFKVRSGIRLAAAQKARAETERGETEREIAEAVANLEKTLRAKAAAKAGPFPLVRRFQIHRWSPTRVAIHALKPAESVPFPLPEFNNAKVSMERLEEAYEGTRQYRSHTDADSITVTRIL